MTLLSWDIPLISFNGSLWDVLLRCSKWLLGRGLIASQWSWDADWSSESNEPAPLSLWHCDPELCSIEKRFNWETAHFMGRPTPLKVNGANFSTLLPPRGATFTPFWGMVLQSLPASSNVANFTFLWNPLLYYEASNFFRNVKSMGQIWDAPAPQGCNFYPILRYGLTEPASLLKCGKFHISVKSTFWATRRQSFSQC